MWNGVKAHPLKNIVTVNHIGSEGKFKYFKQGSEVTEHTQ